MIRELKHADLPAVIELLRASCPWDDGARVADETLFGRGPTSMPTGWLAVAGQTITGVAAVAADRLRVLAVVPEARRQGVGSALLAAAEAEARSQGAARLGCLDEAGNYLAPGIDARNAETIAWLERRGFVRGELRTNLLVDVRGNPKVTTARLAACVAASLAKGYAITKATGAQPALLAAIADEFGGAWPFEVQRALACGGVWIARRDDEICAFAAHDGNNAGLGWFGPAGTWEAHRGQGLGEACLLGCLLEVATEHAQCEIAWIGPEAFYENSAGVAGRRTFIPMRKDLVP